MSAAEPALQRAISADGTPAAPPGAADGADGGDAAAMRRVLRNAVALVVAYALPRVLTLGAVVLAARTLGTARFGAYAAAGAAAVILSILSTAGMQPLLVREIARDRRAAPLLLRSANRIKTVLNVLMLASLWLAASRLFGLQGEALWAALLLGTGYAIGSYAENLAAYFQAVERMHVWTVANAAYGIVAGVTGVVLILLTRSLPWFCAAMVLGHVASVGWLYRTYRRDTRLFVEASPATVRTGRGLDVRALLYAAAPFAAAFLALTVYYKGDVLILSRLRPVAEAGVYVAAYKLVDVAQALVLAAIVATYPRLARAAVTRGHGERWTGTRLAELAVLLVAPAAGLAFLLREPIVGALYGAQYSGAAVPAAFLVPALVPLALNLLAGYVLAAADRMKLVAALYGGAAVIKLVAVAVAAARWGAPGAAAVMLGAEVLLCAGLQLALHRSAYAAAGRRALLPVLAVVAACAGAELLPGVPPGLRVALFITLVAAAYVRLDVLPATEREVLRAALRPAGVRTQEAPQ
jgi:polysaccharide transporter, PST family